MQEANMDSQLSKPIPQHADEKAPTEDKRSSKWSTVKQSIKEGKIQRVATENCECDSDRPDSKRPSEHLQEEEVKQSPPALASSGRQKENVSATMKCKYETAAKYPEEQEEEPDDENHSGQIPQLPSTRADQDGMNSRSIRPEEFLQSYLTALIAASILTQNAQRPGPVNPASRVVPCEGEYSDWEKTSGVENDEKSPHSSDSEEKHHYSTMKNEPRASSSKQPCESVDDTFPALFDNSRLEEKSPGQGMEEESQNKTTVVKSLAPEEQYLKNLVTENQMNVSKFSRIPTEHGDETLAGKDEWNKDSSPEDISHAPFESNTAKANGPVTHDSESAGIIKHDKLAENQADSSDVAGQKHNSTTVAADKEAPSTEQNSEKRLLSTLDQAANERDQNEKDGTTEHFQESGKPFDHPSTAGSNQSNCIHQSVTETANNQGSLSSIQDPGHPQAEETEDPDEITNQLKQNPYQEMYEHVASEDQTPEQARNGAANEPGETAVTSENQLPEQVRSETPNEPSETAVKNEPLEVYEQDTGQNNDPQQKQDHSDHESTGEYYEEHPSFPEANCTLNTDQTEPTFEECIHDAQHVSASLQQEADSEMNICSEAAAPTLEQVLEYSPDTVSAVGRGLNNETEVLESGQQNETAPALSTYYANAELQTTSHQNIEQVTRPFPLENVTYPELEREDSDDATPDSENPSADGFARTSDLTHSAAGHEEDDTHSGPTPNLTQPVQQSVNGGVHWRPGIGRRLGGHSIGDPYSVRVVDLKERYVDMHCPIDAPRGSDRLPELLQLETQVHGFAASDDTGLEQGFDNDTDSGNGNLIQDFINRFRARQQEDQTVCVLCENHLADTVLFQCHHIVVCRACARHMIEGSCCPLPACGAPVVCFVWLG